MDSNDRKIIELDEAVHILSGRLDAYRDALDTMEIRMKAYRDAVIAPVLVERRLPKWKRILNILGGK